MFRVILHTSQWKHPLCQFCRKTNHKVWGRVTELSATSSGVLSRLTTRRTEITQRRAWLLRSSDTSFWPRLDLDLERKPLSSVGDGTFTTPPHSFQDGTATEKHHAVFPPASSSPRFQLFFKTLYKTAQEVNRVLADRVLLIVKATVFADASAKWELLFWKVTAHIALWCHPTPNRTDGERMRLLMMN